MNFQGPHGASTNEKDKVFIFAELRDATDAIRGAIYAWVYDSDTAALDAVGVAVARTGATRFDVAGVMETLETVGGGTHSSTQRGPFILLQTYGFHDGVSATTTGVASAGDHVLQSTIVGLGTSDDLTTLTDGIRIRQSLGWYAQDHGAGSSAYNVFLRVM
jgi:hypothetical protein